LEAGSETGLEQPALSAAEPRVAARRAPRRARASRRPAGATEGAGAAPRSEQRKPELEEASGAPDRTPDEAIPTAAVVDRSSSEPPRRGWWSRFVRKDE
jgi:hypothetical protein